MFLHLGRESPFIPLPILSLLALPAIKLRGLDHQDRNVIQAAGVFCRSDKFFTATPEVLMTHKNILDQRVVQHVVQAVAA